MIREDPRMENVTASTNVVLFMAVILDAAIAALACDWHRSVFSSASLRNRETYCNRRNRRLCLSYRIRGRCLDLLEN